MWETWKRLSERWCSLTRRFIRRKSLTFEGSTSERLVSVVFAFRKQFLVKNNLAPNGIRSFLELNRQKTSLQPGRMLHNDFFYIFIFRHFCIDTFMQSATFGEWFLNEISTGCPHNGRFNTWANRPGAESGVSEAANRSRWEIDANFRDNLLSTIIIELFFYLWTNRFCES